MAHSLGRDMALEGSCTPLTSHEAHPPGVSKLSRVKPPGASRPPPQSRRFPRALPSGSDASNLTALPWLGSHVSPPLEDRRCLLPGPSPALLLPQSLLRHLRDLVTLLFKALNRTLGTAHITVGASIIFVPGSVPELTTASS